MLILFQVIGKKDVAATLLPSCPESGERVTPEGEEFKQMQMPSSVSGARGQQYSLVRERGVGMFLY